MNSGMAAVRAEFKRKAIINEANRIIDRFASDSNSKSRAVTKVVRRIMLDGPYLLNGRMWDVKAKSLGAGVHELWIELQN